MQEAKPVRTKKRRPRTRWNIKKEPPPPELCNSHNKGEVPKEEEPDGVLREEVPKEEDPPDKDETPWT